MKVDITQPALTQGQIIQKKQTLDTEIEEAKSSIALFKQRAFFLHLFVFLVSIAMLLYIESVTLAGVFAGTTIGAFAGASSGAFTGSGFVIFCSSSYFCITFAGALTVLFKLINRQEAIDYITSQRQSLNDACKKTVSLFLNG